jgi:hypothetical protein
MGVGADRRPVAWGPLFFSRILHHSNERVRGVRHSFVAFTQQSVFTYWTKGGCHWKDRKKERLKKRQKSRAAMKKKARVQD